MQGPARWRRGKGGGREVHGATRNVCANELLFFTQLTGGALHLRGELAYGSATFLSRMHLLGVQHAGLSLSLFSILI